VSLKFRERSGTEVTIGDISECLAAIAADSATRVLVIFANFYCDARLLCALADAQDDSILIDSDPPSVIAPLWENSEPHSFGQFSGAALLSNKWFAGRNRDLSLIRELALDFAAGRITAVDAARQQVYVPDMRRGLRPVFFPAPSPDRRPLAEHLLRDATKKGVLDFPALAHAPIEKWIVSRLCRTSITPNQVTLATAFLGLSVTLLYAFGHLWAGALFAMAVGVFDGVDGKLARLKVQTTRIGKGEHALDYCIEMSWWAALGYHFHVTDQLRYAYTILFVFFASDLLDRLAKRSVERQLARSLDDASRFDRLFRYVAGRRNIYTWLFTFCLAIGLPANGFIVLCFWGIATAAVHIVRALQIRLLILGG
jgi:phosphatidylglycerophosphate synthase